MMGTNQTFAPPLPRARVTDAVSQTSSIWMVNFPSGSAVKVCPISSYFFWRAELPATLAGAEPLFVIVAPPLEVLSTRVVSEGFVFLMVALVGVTPFFAGGFVAMGFDGREAGGFGPGGATPAACAGCPLGATVVAFVAMEPAGGWAAVAVSAGRTGDAATALGEEKDPLFTKAGGCMDWVDG